MNKIVLNRFKSFAWRVTMMAIVVLADYIVHNLTGFGLPAVVTLVLGLVAGEVSKFLNTQLGTDLSTPIPKKPIAKKKK